MIVSRKSYVRFRPSSLVVFGGGGGSGSDAGQISANYGPPGSPTAMQSSYQTLDQMAVGLPSSGCIARGAITGAVTFAVTRRRDTAAEAAAIATGVCVFEPGSSGN